MATQEFFLGNIKGATGATGAAGSFDFNSNRDKVVLLNNGAGSDCIQAHLDNFRDLGLYNGYLNGGPSGQPVSGGCIVPKKNSLLVSQLFFSEESDQLAHRKSTGPSAWGPWKTLANTESPVFTGTPKIRDANGRENRIAVVAETTAANETSLPVGSIVLVSYTGAENPPDRNSPLSLYLGNNGYSYANYAHGDAPVGGTWRLCGAANSSYAIGNQHDKILLCRRVA